DAASALTLARGTTTRTSDCAVSNELKTNTSISRNRRLAIKSLSVNISAQTTLSGTELQCDLCPLLFEELPFELDRHFAGNQPAFESITDKTFERRGAARTVVERELIDVHADERVGAPLVQAAAELLRVLDGFGAM